MKTTNFATAENPRETPLRVRASALRWQPAVWPRNVGMMVIDEAVVAPGGGRFGE